MNSDLQMLGALGWATVVGFFAIFLLWHGKNELLKDAALAILRGFLQLLALGLILQVIFDDGSILVQLLSIVVILAFSTIIATERSPLPSVQLLTFGLISFISLTLLLPIFIIGVFKLKANTTIPLAGMAIANVMHATALTLESLHEEMKNSWKELEAWLALGVKPSQSSAPLRRRVVKLAILSNVNGLKAVGIVHIPGLMTGLLINGMTPLTAAILQFLLLAIIFSGGVFSSVFLSNLALNRYFNGPYLKTDWFINNTS